MRGLTGYLPFLKIPTFLLPIIAGIICGIVGLFVPEVLGLGSETIRSLLVDENFYYFDSLLVSKVVLTVVCIRFGLFEGFFSCFVYWAALVVF